MSDLLTKDVQSALVNAPISVNTERRAYGTRRGVPDAVAWLSPEHEAFPDRTLPVLIELEGTFGGAAADFEKFAARYGDSEYQYHLQWPAASEQLEHLRRTCQYDIAGVPARRLGHGPAVTESQMYSAIGDWFNEFVSSFKRSVSVREYDETKILNWELDFRMYGHKFQTKVPYFIQIGSDFRTTIDRFISPPTVPSVVIINDEYGSNIGAISHHATTIEFPALRAIRFNS